MRKTVEAIALGAVVLGACGTKSGGEEGGSTSGVETGAETGSSGSGSDYTDFEPVPSECGEEVPIFQLDGVTPTGFLRCENGLVHREEPVDCLPPMVVDPMCSPEGSCDPECPSGEFCTSVGFGGDAGPDPVCGCVPTCTRDADCEEGKICLCSGVVLNAPGYAMCVPTECASRPDCDGGLCAATEIIQTCSFTTLRLDCTSAEDECSVGSDCPSAPGGCELEERLPQGCGVGDRGRECFPSPCYGDC